MKVRLFYVTLVVGFLFTFSAYACDKGVQSTDQHQQAMENEHTNPDQSTLGDKKSKDTKVKNGFDKMPPVGTKAFCPVMKAEFTVKKDTVYSVYKGKTYVFCCPGCKPKFDADPEKYIKEI